MPTYVIRFDYPEGECYAGPYKGAAGWAPSIATAYTFNSAEKARAFLAAAYGGNSAEWGKVVRVTTQPPSTSLGSLLKF